MKEYSVGKMGWAVCAAFYAALFAVSGAVAAPSGLEIMQQVNDRDDGDNMVAETEMILIDKKGKQRIRKTKRYDQDRGEDTYSLTFFLSPSDVKNTGFLTYDYDESGKDDDQWLYLPALRKTKRIANDDKSGSFMGSDFNYSDMTERDLNDYTFEVMKETEVRGNPVWQINATPKDKSVIKETGYRKSILFVDQEKMMVIRGLHWLEKKGKLRYFDITKLDQIDGIWTATEMTMTTKQGKQTEHKTILRSKNIRYGQDLAENLFTTRRLEQGAK